MRFRAVLGIGAALALAGCGGGAAGRDPGPAEGGAEPVVAVRVAPVSMRTFADAVQAPGQWRAGGELVVSAPFAGLLESLTPQVGDRVRAGERVGMLITRDSWAALQGAELLGREARDDSARAESARALALARHDLVKVPLTASAAGVVIRRSVEPGAQLAETAEILAVAPAGRVVFEARVPSASLPRIRTGQPARIEEEGMAPRVASVQRVLPMASAADQAALVWLTPHGPGAPPALERYGSAWITVGAPRRALGVPDTAVVEDDLTGERRVAVVASGDTVRWTPVTLGAVEQGWREIRAPALTPGTRVVVEGQRGLPAGARVRLQP